MKPAVITGKLERLRFMAYYDDELEGLRKRGRSHKKPSIREEETSASRLRGKSQTSSGEAGRSRSRGISGESDRNRSKSVSGESDRSRSRSVFGEGDRSRSRGVSGESDRSRSRSVSGENDRSRSRSVSGETGRNQNRNFSGDTGRKRGASGESSLGRRESAASAAEISPVTSRMQARKEKEQKKKRIIAMIILECFTLCLIFGYGFVKRNYSLQRLPFNEENVKNNNLSDTVTERMKGYWTIALFGVDSRGTVLDKGVHSDVNMLCNINMDTGEIQLVSVYRDTYLNINDKNSYNKINTAYFQGGPEQAVQAINKNLDLDIRDYASFNWKTVAEAINILGGVDIELSKAEFHYINGFITETVKYTGIPSQHLTHAGMNHLDGVQAVAYGRLRLMDTDFARTERQKKVVKQAFEKAKQADWAVLNNLLVTVFPQVATNIDVEDMIKMGRSISKFYLGENTGFPQARGDANISGKGACVIPTTLESNVKMLHEFLYGTTDYEPSDAVKQISAKISADTGLYNEGKPAGRPSTEGYLPKPTEAPTTAAETEPETESKEVVFATDENGEIIYETNENGETVPVTLEETSEGESTAGIPGGDASGWETWGTDEFGNPVDPAWGDNHGGPGYDPTLSTDDMERPGSDKPESTRPSGENGGPGVPTMEESTTSPEFPGGDTNYPGGGTGNNRPGGDTNQPGGGTGNNQPGGGTGNNGPGGSTESSGSGGNGPGGSGDDVGIILPPG